MVLPLFMLKAVLPKCSNIATRSTTEHGQVELEQGEKHKQRKRVYSGAYPRLKFDMHVSPTWYFPALCMASNISCGKRNGMLVSFRPTVFSAYREKSGRNSTSNWSYSFFFQRKYGLTLDRRFKSFDGQTIKLLNPALEITLLVVMVDTPIA